MKKHLILVALMLLSSAAVQADVISLTTNKAAGEKIKIAINAGGQTTLAWGNGELQTVKFDGYPMEIEVKDVALTLTTEKPLLRFYAPNAGIETLDLAKAVSLVQLVVPDNALTTLSFTKNKEIKVVDIQNNALGALTFSGRSNPQLEYLNCANNQLTTLSVPVGSSSPLRVLICSGNRLTKVPLLAAVEPLETVWAGQNAFTGSVQLDAAAGLRLLNIEGNEFENVVFAATSGLEGLWAGDNQLQTLDLSEGVPALKYLSVPNNRLAQVLWPTGRLDAMDYVNLSGNQLFFNSFPMVDDAQKIVLAPQEPFFFTDTVNVNTSVDNETLMLLSNKRLDTNRNFAMYDAQSNALVKGTSDDYNYTRRGVFTFYTAQDDACFVVTSPNFEGVELRSLPFCVFDPATGIEEIRMEMFGDEMVYDAQGRVVSSDTKRLPAGIYIVKGKKIVVK